MKKCVNLLVLTSFLMTTMPITPATAGVSSSSEEEILIPAEARALSEQLVLENNGTAVSEDGPSCIKSGVAYSPRMNRAQRKELFIKGQITDCEGNIWNIKVIPGSDASKEMTINSWRFAGRQTKQMFKIDTYKRAIRHGKYASKGSFNFAKSSSKLLKKGIWDYMIVEGVYNDLIKDNARVWKNAGITVANLRGSFGWLFGAVYAGVLKPVTLTGANIIKAAYHIGKGTVILVGGVAGTAGGIVATVASPVIVPVVEVMTRPLLAVGSILTTGTIIPGVVYVWNGSAWITSQLSHVPDSETIVGGVPFVTLENPKQPEKPKVEVTTQNLSEVVEVGVKVAAKKTQQSALASQRNEVLAKIAELQKEADALNRKSYALEDAFNKDDAVKAVYQMVRKVYNADVTISPEVQAAALNEQELKDLVLKYAEEKGITLTDAEIEIAVADIKKTLKALGTK